MNIAASRDEETAEVQAIGTFASALNEKRRGSAFMYILHIFLRGTHVTEPCPMTDINRIHNSRLESSAISTSP